ncbi:kelch domain-containing protein 3 [Agrilus planipennis]|uniref:Kelch domain-containing protein 3 n=1 Tax=Agrilus planipennis TaxID=224129 RepID=A0A1W4XJA4_AGRPL|nr:kelch domain-containing protein 3 [Agrilus planipennis]
MRDFHTAAVINDKMYIFGGRGTESPFNLYVPGKEIYCNNLWFLDLQTNEWHRPHTIGTPPTGRRSHSAFVHNNKMYIFGGYNALFVEHYNDMFEFNPVTLEWKMMNPLGKAPCNRRRQACIVSGDRLFLFGGTSPVSFFPGAQEQFDGDNIDDQLIDHSDMHILDFHPSLKTLCMLTVRKYKLDTSSLPHCLKVEYKNMFSPNKITINRPNNSAG